MMSNTVLFKIDRHTLVSRLYVFIVVVLVLVIVVACRFIIIYRDQFQYMQMFLIYFIVDVHLVRYSSESSRFVSLVRQGNLRLTNVEQRV
jgi:hypothetical protein